MRSADSLSPSQRDRLARISLQFFVDDHVEGPQRQARAEQLAREAWARRRSTWRDQVRYLGIPVLVTLVLAAAVAFALLLIAPARAQVQPYGDVMSTPDQATHPAPARLRSALQDRADLVARAHEIARDHGIPPKLLVAQVSVESSWNPKAIGKAGEVGLMQLSAPVARRWGVDPHDPIQNLIGGARELRSHYGPGGWTRALIRYNGRGPMARAYAQKVLRAWESGS